MTHCNYAAELVFQVGTFHASATTLACHTFVDIEGEHVQTRSTPCTIPCGDYWDNDSVFHRAVFAVQSGDIDLGYDMLIRLHRHICDTQEPQSIRWILPSIETTLAAIERLRSPKDQTQPRLSTSCNTRPSSREVSPVHDD